MRVRSELPLIACSLDGGSQRARVAEWARLLGEAATREETADGVCYSFAAAVGDLERQIQHLAAAEHACCSFLDFDIQRVDDRVELTVSAPPEGQEALRFVFSA
jgi:hypothetical protein